MVLADCITHARNQGCDALVDIATLTGGVIAALGTAYSGLFSNDDALSERSASAASGPASGSGGCRSSRLCRDDQEQLAQLSNRPMPRVGLASAAAEFLHHFVGDVPWAHLDMAAVGDDRRAPYLDRGGSGWGARLLTELALGYASA